MLVDGFKIVPAEKADKPPAPPPLSSEEKREQILMEALQAVNGSRDLNYGDPEDNFGVIAKLWEIIFGHEVKKWQVPLAMIAVKMARLINNPNHRDGWVDTAGYAAGGGQITWEER